MTKASKQKFDSSIFRNACKSPRDFNLRGLKVECSGWTLKDGDVDEVGLTATVKHGPSLNVMTLYIKHQEGNLIPQMHNGKSSVIYFLNAELRNDSAEAWEAFLKSCFDFAHEVYFGMKFEDDKMVYCPVIL